jgi:hypothetical protein
MVALLLFLGSVELFAQPVRDTVAIPDFDYPQLELKKSDAQAISEWFTIALQNTGKYVILERSSLDKIFKEQKLSSSEFFNEEKAIELGRLIPAQKLILGRIGVFDKDRFTITIKMINSKTGVVEGTPDVIEHTGKLADIRAKVEISAKKIAGTFVEESYTWYYVIGGAVVTTAAAVLLSIKKPETPPSVSNDLPLPPGVPK